MDLRPGIIVFEIPAKVTEKTFFGAILYHNLSYGGRGYAPNPTFLYFTFWRKWMRIVVRKDRIDFYDIYIYCLN